MTKIIDTVDLVHTFHYEAREKQGIYHRGPFQLMMNTNVIWNDYWMKGNAPFRLSDYHMSLILKGSISGVFNLQYHEFHEGDVYLLHPGLLCKFVEATDDINFRIVSISGDYITEQFPAFGVDRGLIVFHPSPEEWEQLVTYFNLLEKLVDQEELVLLSAAYSALRYAVLKGNAAMGLEDQKQEHNPHQDIFQQFLSLLNEHGIREHKMAFYADKLSYTPKYLNTIIKEVSERTMMDWINTYLIDEARASLAHTKMSVEQISDALCFPNSAFFCKFFKNHTGMRPSEYRKNVRNH